MTMDMDDLISNLSGAMHVSQEGHDLESFKAALARTMALPPSPTDSDPATPRTRPPSISLPPFMLQHQLQHQPYPSPSSTVASAEFPFSSDGKAAPYEYSEYNYEYALAPTGGEMDMELELESAFAGDAFAPMWQTQQTDPWALFRDKQAGAFGNYSSFAPSFAPTQTASVQVQVSAPEWPQEQAEQDLDRADEMLVDSDEL